MNNIYRADHKKISNFSKYCNELGSSLLQFKSRFERIPMYFIAVQYKVWKRQVSHVFHSKIQAYPSQFKLVDQIAISNKMEVYLKTACKLITNLVIDLPYVNSEDIDDKRWLVGNFASTCGDMGWLLMNLDEPLYEIALMLKVGDKDFTSCKDLFEKQLKEIFKWMRYFKNELDEDLPYHRDVIQWAYDLRDCILEMCCCEPCCFSVN